VTEMQSVISTDCRDTAAGYSLEREVAGGAD
jgi:hypothetical protein